MTADPLPVVPHDPDLNREQLIAQWQKQLEFCRQQGFPVLASIAEEAIAALEEVLP